MAKRSVSSFHNKILREQQSLTSFALRLTLNKDHAHDLVQETTLRALDNEAKYVDESNFKGWVHTIMRNIFLNNCRHQSYIASNIDYSADIVEILPDTDATHTPESSYAVAEISEIIASFPEDYSKPLNMHIAGYKYSEIAEALQMPLGSVKAHIFFTRKRLREMLKDFR